MPRLKAPFPYFGGKAKVAKEVWHRFGRVDNYVEPFFGSGAVLLGRPEVQGVETVNDLDGLLANFWRSIQADPVAVAKWADWPVNENDLHARHAWLVGQKDSLQAKLEGDPEWFDPKVAGWWVWGLCAWIGSGWCSGDGPWRVVDGVMVETEKKTAMLAKESTGNCLISAMLAKESTGNCLISAMLAKELPTLMRAWKTCLLDFPIGCDVFASVVATGRESAERLRRSISPGSRASSWTRLIPLKPTGICRSTDANLDRSRTPSANGRRNTATIRRCGLPYADMMANT